MRTLSVLIPAVLAAIVLSACGTESVSVPESDGAAYEGAEIFATHCSGCHTLSAAGTQGSGLWCSDRARTRFARLDLPLPSPDVFSLAAFPKEAPEHFFAGTSEGLLRLPADALPETR